MSAKHTPVPWKCCFDLCHEWALVTDASGGIIANVNTKSGPDIPQLVSRKMPADANAKFIVRACNANDELLEALEEITFAMMNMRDDSDTAALFGEIKAAQPTIAKAKVGAS